MIFQKNKIYLGALALGFYLSAFAQIDPVPAPHVAPVPAINPASSVVDKLSGEASVTPGGSAAYSFSILTLPASGGYAPDISINYNSQAGNGSLGLGWAIGGLSSIDRSTATIEQDGFNQRVNYNDLDRFTLDGQRLVLTKGNYAQNFSEYRTEIDQFDKIILIRTPGASGPSYFKVLKKDGSIAYYGQTGDSRIRANTGATVSWRLDRMEDPAGNYFLFDYLETSDGEHLLKNILYTGNDAEGVEPYNRVAFNYTLRSGGDWQISYSAGKRVFQRQRLASVMVYTTPEGGAETEVRRYVPGYGTNNSNQQIVTSWKECVGSDCFPPTVFTYQSGRVDWSSQTQTTQIPDSFNGFQLGDVTGDGKLDMVWLEFSNNLKVYFQVAPSDGRNFDFSFQPHRIEGSDPLTFQFWQLLDFDQDGKQDLLLPVPGQDWVVYRSITSHFDTAPIRTGIPTWVDLAGASLTDANGDGLTDLLLAKRPGVFGTTPKFHSFFPMERAAANAPFPYRFGSAQPMPTLPASPSSVGGFTRVSQSLEGRRPVDFDNDGILDYLATVTEIPGCLRFSDPATSPNGEPVCIEFGPAAPPRAHIYTMGENGRYEISYTLIGMGSAVGVYTQDLNNDGLVDMLYGRAGLYYYRLNTGNRDFSEERAVGLAVNSVEDRGPGAMTPAGGNRLLELIDINRDGSLDLVYPAAGGNHYFVKAWNGQGFGTAKRTALFFNDYEEEQHLFADINGDGYTDFTRIIDNQVIQVRLFDQAFVARNVLSTVRDGFGVMDRFTYQSLTEPGVYQRDFDAARQIWGKGSPVYDLFAPMYLVTKLENSSPFYGNPTHLNLTQYTYHGGKMQAGGRGFLGFRAMDTRDFQTGLRTRRTFRLDFPFTGMLSEQERVQTKAPFTIVKKDRRDYQIQPNIPGVFYPVMTEMEAANYDLQGRLMNRMVMKPWNDNFGNLTRTEESVFDSLGTLKRREVTTNTYFNDEANWRIGLLLRAVVSATKDGQNLERTTAFDYDPRTSRLNRQLVEPEGQPHEQLLTTYELDGFGNRIQVRKQAIADPNSLPREMSFTYDRRGRFVEFETNSEGQVLSWIEQRDLLGTPTRVVSDNGFISETFTDAFGQIYFTRNNRGTSAKTQRFWCAGKADCPPGAVLKSELNSPGRMAKIIYIDALGRTVRTWELGFDGRAILEETGFNAAGLVGRKSEPYYVGDAPQWNLTEYDILDRPTKMTAADGGVATVGYQGLTVSMTNALQQTEVRQQNALGETVVITDAMGGVVRYGYNPQGNLAFVIDAEGNGTGFIHDRLGRKVYLDDPDKGLTTYQYNAFGELVRQVDGKQQRTEFRYDRLGKEIQRMAYDASGTLVSEMLQAFHLVGNGIGQVASITDTFTGVSKSFAYDETGRLTECETTIDGESFLQKTTYDAFGRTFQQYDASGNGLRYIYNGWGSLSETREIDHSETYRVILEKDAFGNVIKERAGNGLITTRTYDATSGRIQAIRTGDQVQDWEYQFDLDGNLVERATFVGTNPLSETFSYDSLNRLTEARVSGGQVQSFAYDALGNLRFKSDVGSYSYASGKPHAVTQAGNVSYQYDANGNMVADTSGRVFEYTGFDKPSLIRKGSFTTRFEYDPMRNLIRRTASGDAGDEEHVYVGQVEFIRRSDGSTSFKRRIGDALVTEDGSDREVLYIHKDFLGSTDVITDSSQQIVAESSFDAFGQRRDPGTGATLNDPINQAGSDVAVLQEISEKGFSQHRQLDQLGIIDMGGRIYDPNLGRFLQADVFVQEPENSQSLNRYSYVLNNPLSYTDPSGFFFKNALKSLKSILKGRILQAASSIALKSLNAAVPGLGTAIGTALDYVGRLMEARSFFAVATAILDGNVKGILANSFASFAGTVLADNLIAFTKAATGQQMDQMETAAQSGKIDFATYLKLAICAYKSRETDCMIKGFVKGEPIETEEGLFGIVLIDEENMRAVVAFRGSQGLSDIDDNILQALGLPSSQYSNAVDFAQKINATLPENYAISFTGHSLGGGLASAAALATGRMAVTFNPAGVSLGTARRFNFDRSAGKDLITAYTIRGDALSLVQNLLPFLPPTTGKQVQISPNFGAILQTPLSQHLIRQFETQTQIKD